MSFDVTSRWDGKVKFTADIEALDSTAESIKMGMAAVWGHKNEADLGGANLSRADLGGANLSRADLSRADLGGANLSRADLGGANLSRANLSRADLGGANLSRADLGGANLSRADLYGADLSGANLSWAYLSRADLSRADLYGADLSGANLSGVSGINDWIKCIQIDTYPITYTAEILQIGCESHPLDEWREFDDERIIRMDGKKALQFWRKYKDWIFQTIELCPARPTKGE